MFTFIRDTLITRFDWSDDQVTYLFFIGGCGLAIFFIIAAVFAIKETIEVFKKSK